MPASTPPGAVREFLGPLRHAVACVTRARVEVSADGYRPNPDGSTHLLYVNRGQPVALGGRHRLSLRVSMRYRIVRGEGARGPWKIKTAGYAYAIDDHEGREVLAYHWHEWMPPPYPHLHLGVGAVVGALMQKRHLPTGRVALEAVLRLLLTELAVEPLRRDWRAILKRGGAAVRDLAYLGVKGPHVGRRPAPRRPSSRSSPSRSSSSRASDTRAGSPVASASNNGG